VCGNIDADLAHYSDGFKSNLARFRSRREDFVAIAARHPE
jgi:hypothetical protein